jgi:hypothetical protein
LGRRKGRVPVKSSYLNLFPKADLCNGSAHNCTER